MLVGTKFPPTERVAAGVSVSGHVQGSANPFFLVWFFSMFLTAASELAPGQWVNVALTRTVGMQGIWLLIYVSGLMFVMRHFAGPMAHKFSPVGLLWISCLLASARPGRLELRELSRHRSSCSHGMGNRCLLHVADDARRRF